MNKKRAFLLFFAPFFVVGSLQANIIFPLPFFLSKPAYLFNPLMIILALLIEFLFIQKLTGWSIKNCAVATILMNFVSAFAGTALMIATTWIPFVEYEKSAYALGKALKTGWNWDTWLTNIFKGLWLGEFSAVEVLFWGITIIFAVAATNALIEGALLKSFSTQIPFARDRKPPTWKTILFWIGLANLITTTLQIVSITFVGLLTNR